jgi:tetratricopeptide (TPR) repeat protein
VLAAGALALAGCGGLPIGSDPPEFAGGSVEVKRVPFFPQEQHQCGPAALAMALGAAGERVTAEQLVPEVYLPGREGSLQAEMLAGARRRGLVAYPLSGGLESLHAELAAGTPVIVLQNLGFEWLPRWHYAVAIGYDAPRRQVILHSGVTPRLAMDLRAFDATWRRSERWAMLALPPGRIPAAATAEGYLQAVVALEKAGQPRAAQASYRAATRRWPDSLVAWMGLGNTSHALGDLAGAERAFREAAQRHPDSAAALNNLAQVLAERRRFPEAIRAARAAVRLGGREAATAQQTLESILAQSAAR